MDIIKEACVGDLQQAIQAEKNGANRIELCARLDVGGTTPSQQLIEDCLKHLSIPIKVMIRPRGGNFIYTATEIETMISDINMCKQLGIPEVVTGLLTQDHQVDMDGMLSLSANVADMPITFHKAIDELSDFESAISQLKKIPQVKFILSSGLKSTAEKGIDNLKKMIKLCGDNITVIAAGKVTDSNIARLHAALNGKEYHGKLIVGNLS